MEQLKLAAKAEGVQQGKKGPVPCLKPEKFTYGNDIKDYTNAWDNYRRIQNIADPVIVRSFLTFLDEKSREKIRTLKLTSIQKDNWENTRPLIELALEPPSEKV